MKRCRVAVLAGLALAAAHAGWAQDVTILNARIAVGDGPVIQNGYIVVQNGRIVTVGPGRPAQSVGNVIDASGMTALPGLIDGHKHINTGPYEKEQMEDLIAHGFTTVLSGGGPAEGNLKLMHDIDSGLINGPHVLPSGSFFGFNMTPEQGRAAVRAMAAQGIKFTGEMPTTPEPTATAAELALLSAAIDEGRKVGVTVVVHAVSTPAMVATTQIGIRHQVHLPNKDYMSYHDAALIANSGTIVLDLISFGDPIIDVFQKDDTPRFRTGLLWPESIAGANRDDDGAATGTEGAYTLINARRIWDASHGRGLGFGSDQGYAVRDILEHELKSLMVMFSMQDVIRIMTLNTATFLNLQNEIGTITPMKRADIELVQGNPFEDFHALLDTRVVLKDGKVVVDKRSRRDAAASEEAGASNAASNAPPVGTLTASVARPDQIPVMGCSQLTAIRSTQARVLSARDAAGSSLQVPASTAYDRRAGEIPVPARCEVQLQLQAVRGAAGRVQLWLPNTHWNARLLLLGGGPGSDTAMTAELAQGYAVMASASGAPARAAPRRGTPASDQRLAHDAVTEARTLLAAYYGGSARYAYWSSRTADVAAVLAALQANPADFDGVVVGAPEDAAGSEGAGDLSAFAARGGKLIEYHGGGGHAAATDNAVKAYQSVAARSGGVEQTRESYRLFLLPDGKQGDTFRVRWVAALDEWVQRGRAPDVVLAEHDPPADAPPVAQPRGVVFEPQYGVHTVCAYPMVAVTLGTGAETPVDYLCVSASRAQEVEPTRPPERPDFGAGGPPGGGPGSSSGPGGPGAAPRSLQ